MLCSFCFGFWFFSLIHIFIIYIQNLRNFPVHVIILIRQMFLFFMTLDLVYLQFVMISSVVLSTYDTSLMLEGRAAFTVCYLLNFKYKMARKGLLLR